MSEAFDDALETVIVGFDLGHGQTALALAYASKDAPPAVLALPGSTDKQHVTAVAEHPKLGVLVGEGAAGVRGVSRLYVGFKSPEFGAEPVRRPTTLFVQKVVADVQEKALVPRAGRVRWVVGAPSGWSSQIRAAYAALLRDAGLAEVEVIPESRAALLSARECGEVPLRTGGRDKAVLIVDIGSSTTDYTSVIGREAKLVDRGNTRLGASLIDREILRQQLERHPLRARLEEIMLDDPAVRLRLELLCRRVKEDYFRTPQERFRDNPQAKVPGMDSIPTAGDDLDVVVRLGKADMDAVLTAPQPTLGGQSWIEAFRADLAAALQRLGRRLEVVVLTGGPSRMDFVLDVCQQAVGADVEVRCGSEPEFAIARGLALAGRISIKTKGFRADVRQFIESGQIESLVKERLPELTQAMGAAVASGITERYIIPAFRQWRNRDIKTLNAMTTIIANQVNEGLQNENSTALAEAVATWQNGLRPQLEERTRTICRRWGISADALTLPEIGLDGSPLNVKFDAGAATAELKSVANIVNVLVAGIGATLLFGHGVALIATTGPVGVLIAFVVAVSIGVIGREAAMEKALSADLPMPIRRFNSEQKLVAKLRREAPAKEEELAGEFAKEFRRNQEDKIKDGVSQSIAQQLDALADKAELLIS